MSGSTWMASSISTTSWLAPPCSGPQRAFIPAATEANRLAWLEPTKRTVAVEQFCPWSAWRMSSTLSALAMIGSTFCSSTGRANIMWRKFST